MTKGSEKRFLFYLGHPAHYHNISVVAPRLAAKGHRIFFVARPKDVLADLLAGCPYPVQYVSDHGTGPQARLTKRVLRRWLQMFKIVSAFRPHVMIGTDVVIAQLGRLLRIPALILNEDDAAAVPLLAKYGFKYATAVLSPHCCNVTPYEHKKIGYLGYHELAYLHPNHFSPDSSRVRRLLDGREQYFILRFAALTAHHDDGRTGITTAVARTLMELLAPHGRICITSERPLEPEFEAYRLPIPPKDIHHALAFARLYIGDSQTMAAEAAVMGTPSVRFNDFVGELSYLEELEKRFGLTIGIRTERSERLYKEVERLLFDGSVLQEGQRRRRAMLRETIDVAQFFEHTFERYARAGGRAGLALDESATAQRDEL